VHFCVTTQSEEMMEITVNEAWAKFWVLSSGLSSAFNKMNHVVVLPVSFKFLSGVAYQLNFWECNEISRAINDRVGEVGVAKPVVRHGHALQWENLKCWGLWVERTYTHLGKCVNNFCSLGDLRFMVLGEFRFWFASSFHYVEVCCGLLICLVGQTQVNSIFL
jgi:hypothetical protein